MGLATLTRAQLRQRVLGANGLRGLLTGTAVDGSDTQSTTALVDASADGLLDSGENANRFDPGGTLGLWGGATSTAFEWHRIRTYTPSSGKVTIGRTAFATTPITAVTPWEVNTTGFSPDEVHDCITWACRSLLVDEWQALAGLVPDGTMEDSGVTNWTGTNATVTKTTTEANIARGTQALSVVTTAANGYAESPSIPVGESKTYRVFALVRCVTAGSTASVVVRDHTAGAAITVSWANLASVPANDYGDFRLLAGSFTTPAACVNVRLRLQNDTITATSYFDDVLLYPVDARWLPLPTWLTDPEHQLVDVYSDRYVNTGAQDYVRTPLRPFYGAAGNPTGVTAYRLAVPAAMIAPIVIHAARAVTEPTADSSTVPAVYGDALTTGALYQAYQAGARPRGMDAAAFAAERSRVERYWWGYAAHHNPLLKGGRPARTRIPDSYWQAGSA